MVQEASSGSLLDCVVNFIKLKVATSKMWEEKFYQALDEHKKYKDAAYSAMYGKTLTASELFGTEPTLQYVVKDKCYDHYYAGMKDGLFGTRVQWTNELHKAVRFKKHGEALTVYMQLYPLSRYKYDVIRISFKPTNVWQEEK